MRFPLFLAVVSSLSSVAYVFGKEGRCFYGAMVLFAGLKVLNFDGGDVSTILGLFYEPAFVRRGSNLDLHIHARAIGRRRKMLPAQKFTL